MITLSTSDVLILFLGIYLLAITALALGTIITRKMRSILRDRPRQAETIDPDPSQASLHGEVISSSSKVDISREKIEFDTSTARPLMPAVAAERFAQWMRGEGYTDYLWVGELDACYQWFCRENNYFPVEAKALRELLYRVPGVYWGRPRLGGANWERFRRQMNDWYAERGQTPPERPVVIRILPVEMVQTPRVRDWPGVEQYESGSVPPRARTAAGRTKKLNRNKPDGRVQQRPIVESMPPDLQWRRAEAA